MKDELSGLAAWDDFVKRSVVSSRGAAQLQAHPHFSATLRAIAAAALAMHDADVSTTASHPDAGMIMLGNLIFFLHGTGGVTHTRLRDACRQSGMMSPGRASAIVARLRRIGYLTPAATGSDGKVRLYAPTASMIADFQRRFRLDLDPLVRIEPDMRMLLDRFPEPSVFFAYMVQFGLIAPAAFARMPKRLAPFFKLIEHNIAFLIVMAMFEAVNGKDDFPSAGAAPLSVAGLAHRFRTSRTQIRRLLAGMERDGFIVRKGIGTMVVKPVLRRAFRDYFATLLVAFMAIAYRTIQKLPNLGGPT